ncbi:MAG: hypothetical protein BroJett018_08780 [Chloroflexota bacterium]|nr:hypothetical protein [Chloroflexota bacterium]NOG62707.1 hypothetical protein [Chloroflexota bacterium]GIK63084.1 MAG: hypothetical protein BroJett018_08780 [Chloroflexota bacterium]
MIRLQARYTLFFTVVCCLPFAITSCQQNEDRPALTPVLTPGETYYLTTNVDNALVDFDGYSLAVFNTLKVPYTDEMGKNQERLAILIFIWNPDPAIQFNQSFVVSEGDTVDLPNHRLRILKLREDNEKYLAFAVLKSTYTNLSTPTP